MPVPVATGEVVQVLHRYTLEGQECQNVWYFRAQAPDPDMLANLLSAVAQCLITTLIPILVPSYRLESIKGKVVSPAVGPETEWLPDADDVVVGAAASDGLPSYAAALISIHTERGGRSGRGRIYIGGIAEEDAGGSFINTETPTWGALLAFAACMLDKFKPRDVPAAGNYSWGVMSRKVGGEKPPFLAAGYATITRLTPKRELATMRSRKQGRGR